MAVGDAYLFPGFLTLLLPQLFFPKPPTTFPACFCRGERRKYTGKKSRVNRGSNSQPPGHESNMLTTEPPRQDWDCPSQFLLATFREEFTRISLSLYSASSPHLLIQWNPLISNSDFRDFLILATFCPAQNHFLFNPCKFARIIEMPLKEIFG